MFVDAENVKLVDKHHHEHEHEDEEKKKGPCCNFTPFVLMLALSIHSIFEGLALGLETNLTSAIDLMVAILLHKFAEALSLSISLGKSFPGNFKIVFWLIF